MRNPRTSIGRLALVLAWGWLSVSASAVAQVVNENRGAAAAAKGEGAGAAPVQATLTDRPEDEKAVRAMAEVFTRAYDAGDAKAVAALYTDDAEFIDEFGDSLEGRAAIQGFYEAMFQERRGAKITILIDSLRFLGPDAAKEAGHTKVAPAEGEPTSLRRYTVLYVKQGGHWLYSSVREEHATGIAHHERLKAWNGWSVNGSTRAPTRRCTSVAAGLPTRISCSATSPFTSRASPS